MNVRKFFAETLNEPYKGLSEHPSLGDPGLLAAAFFGFWFSWRQQPGIFFSP